MDRKVGTVAATFPNKAYGFILADDDVGEYFFHFSTCEEVPEAGDPVDFQPLRARDGRWRAVKVRKASNVE